jgi:hypothetical protein
MSFSLSSPLCYSLLVILSFYLSPVFSPLPVYEPPYPSQCTYQSTGLVTGEIVFDSRQRQETFASLQRPDRLWGPPGLLSNRHRGLRQDSFT